VQVADEDGIDLGQVEIEALQLYDGGWRKIEQDSAVDED